MKLMRMTQCASLVEWIIAFFFLFTFEYFVLDFRCLNFLTNLQNEENVRTTMLALQFFFFFLFPFHLNVKLIVKFASRKKQDKNEINENDTM